MKVSEKPNQCKKSILKLSCFGFFIIFSNLCPDHIILSISSSFLPSVKHFVTAGLKSDINRKLTNFLLEVTYKTGEEQGDDRLADYMFVSVRVKHIIRRSPTSPSLPASNVVRPRWAVFLQSLMATGGKPRGHPEPWERGTETRDQWRHAMMLVTVSPQKQTDKSVTQENKYISVPGSLNTPRQSVMKLSN